MTLVFMEREYSSPEDPHLGIVHLVEVGVTSSTATPLPRMLTDVNIQHSVREGPHSVHLCPPPLPLLTSPPLPGELPPRPDGQRGVPGGADDGAGVAGLPPGAGAPLPVRPLRLPEGGRAGGGRRQARRSPRQQRGDLHVPRQLPGRLLSGRRRRWRRGRRRRRGRWRRWRRGGGVGWGGGGGVVEWVARVVWLVLLML